MSKMVLVLDESGAKGCAKTREKYDGEIGVMAGFLYTESEMRSTETYLNRVLRRHKKESGEKFHITDLDNHSQAKLRDEIFGYIKRANFRWFYQAVYAEGFHQSEFVESRGGNEDGKKSLHVTLFQHMFIQGLCMAASIGIKKLSLEVKTDHVDKGILKRFEQVAEATSDLFQRRGREFFQHVPADEPGKFEKQYYVISTECDAVPQFEEIKFNIACEYSTLTIMADILANSVHHYLDEAQKATPRVFLNNKEVLKEHPVAHLALAPYNENHISPLLDIIYRRIKGEILVLPPTTGNGNGSAEESVATPSEKKISL